MKRRDTNCFVGCLELWSYKGMQASIKLLVDGRIKYNNSKKMENWFFSLHKDETYWFAHTKLSSFCFDRVLYRHPASGSVSGISRCSIPTHPLLYHVLCSSFGKSFER